MLISIAQVYKRYAKIRKSLDPFKEMPTYKAKTHTV